MSSARQITALSRKAEAVTFLQGVLVPMRVKSCTRIDMTGAKTNRKGEWDDREVEKRGMPTELALLPFIESAFNPQAMSSAKASGMWQFIPSTGRDFELRQNIFRDDRRDVLASTEAALDYLQKLHAMFDDWHLALDRKSVV